ncbi:acetylxylan esterase [Lacticaseibacillus camelliae]|uniref:acetylxylan esterase n=1 Tax=Lacticaseibacillus camelliae TaxID=381742 RepID=UPI000B2921BA|nr:acetylxylan esterase [Lacticaseibacillus camelliae]
MIDIKQFKDYRGMGQRPADFDAFWALGLKEMRAVAPEVHQTPVPIKSRLAQPTTTGSPGSAARAFTRS